MRRATWLLIWIAATSVLVVAADDADLRIGRWSLFRGVERALQGTAGVVQGEGDAIAVGAGGTIRIIGGIVHGAGGNLEGLGDAVAGDQSEEYDVDTGSALRSVASRPIRVVGRALRAVGDTTNFLGETTERLTSEAAGILPDTVRVVESGVRSLRGIMDGEDPDYGASTATGSRAVVIRRHAADTPPFDSLRGQH